MEMLNWVREGWDVFCFITVKVYVVVAVGKRSGTGEIVGWWTNGLPS